MYECLHIDKWGKKIMVKDYHRLLGLTVKKSFFNDRSTKDVELHYYCYILKTHM